MIKIVIAKHQPTTMCPIRHCKIELEKLLLILICIAKGAYYISTILDHKTINTVLPQDEYGFTPPMGQNRIFWYFQNLDFFFSLSLDFLKMLQYY